MLSKMQRNTMSVENRLAKLEKKNRLFRILFLFVVIFGMSLFFLGLVGSTKKIKTSHLEFVNDDGKSVGFITSGIRSGIYIKTYGDGEVHFDTKKVKASREVTAGEFSLYYRNGKKAASFASDWQYEGGWLPVPSLCYYSNWDGNLTMSLGYYAGGNHNSVLPQLLFFDSGRPEQPHLVLGLEGYLAASRGLLIQNKEGENRVILGESTLRNNIGSFSLLGNGLYYHIDAQGRPERSR